MNRPQVPEANTAPVPWADPTVFAMVNRAIVHLLDRHALRAETVRAMAEEIGGRMAGLFPTMDALCVATCPWCPDICCLSATVWLDLKDLLFLHLTGRSIPNAQPMKGIGDTCRHLGRRGCRLPRLHRPWICTWYLCATQKACLRRMPSAAESNFHETVVWIRNERKRMETAFIRMTAE